MGIKYSTIHRIHGTNGIYVYPETKKRPLQSSLRLLSRLFLAVPQHTAQDLPAGALGNDIDEFDSTLQPLMASLVILDMLLDRSDDGCVAPFGGWTLHDVSLGKFARGVVGYGNHGAVSDVRVGEDMGFKLSGCDLQSLYNHMLVDS